MTTVDLRLVDVPLRPVTCHECEATVLVRKASWEQTTVQWDQDAQRQCLERRAAGPGAFRGCSGLAETIRHAAARGDLPVVAGS